MRGYEALRTVEEQVFGDELRQLANLHYRVRHGERLAVVRDRTWALNHTAFRRHVARNQ